jgi:hypothetical protein
VEGGILMNIDDARKFLDQLEKVNSDIEVLIVVPHDDIKDHLDNFEIRGVLQNSVWNEKEVVFKDKKV